MSKSTHLCAIFVFLGETTELLIIFFTEIISILVVSKVGKVQILEIYPPLSIKANATCYALAFTLIFFQLHSAKDISRNIYSFVKSCSWLRLTFLAFAKKSISTFRFPNANKTTLYKP